MNELNEVFNDAKLYEKYLYTKMNANGYLIWAGLGLLGSIISYVITIFGEALEINDDKIGPLIGTIWLLVVSTGILFGFRVSPELYSNDTNITFDKSVAKNIWIGWFLSFTIGIFISFPLASISDGSDIILIAVASSIGLGNINNYLNLRKYSKQPFVVGIIILFFVPLIAITGHPFDMLIFGIAISLPYYILGYYLYNIEMPSLLRARKRGKTAN